MAQLSTDIIPLIDKIRVDKLELNEAEMLEKYQAFKDLFPKLYEGLLDETSETKIILDKQLKLLKMREEGSISRFNADVRVGNLVADKYLYNHLPRPSENQYLVAHNKVKKQDEEVQAKLAAGIDLGQEALERVGKSNKD
jgi:hypothetical protein